MMTFLTKKVEVRVQTSRNWVSTRWLLDSTTWIIGQYKITIQQNQAKFFDSTWWFFKQIKLKCGYAQVDIGTVWDENWANY